MSSTLQRTGTMASLMQRLQMSQACLDTVKACLPPAMASHVSSGALDHDGSWTLLAANSAVSAKLRQLQPRLMDALADRGLKVNAIRVRVQNSL